MKPDPDFPVCIFSPASKRKPAAVQLLDYNISVSSSLSPTEREWR